MWYNKVFLLFPSERIRQRLWNHRAREFLEYFNNSWSNKDKCLKERERL